MPANLLECCGRRRRGPQDDSDPLLPEDHDSDTKLQEELQRKLHTYYMLRALFKQGHLPSTEQSVIILRAALASDVLNPARDASIRQSSRLTIASMKQLMSSLIDLIQHKISDDQLQNLIWALSRSKVSVDSEDLAQHVGSPKASTAAAYQAVKSIGGLALGNPEFRQFLGDVQVVGREILRDSAFATSAVAEETAKDLEPGGKPGNGDDKAAAQDDNFAEAPTGQDLTQDATNAAATLGDGVAKVGKEASKSAEEHLTGGEREALVKRVQKAVTKLRERADYSSSVDTLSTVIKNSFLAYLQVVGGEEGSALQQDVHVNEELKYAVEAFMSFLRSFGELKEWEELEKRVKVLGNDQQSAKQEVEKAVTQVAGAFQQLLTDPETYSDIEGKYSELREKVRKSLTGTNIGKDLDAVLDQLKTVLTSAAHDEDVSKVFNASSTFLDVLFPADTSDRHTKTDLVNDFINDFGPSLVQAVQYIPIPRLEVSVPSLDLLLENLILEPGKTVANTSFLPTKLRMETRNDVEIRKARVSGRTITSTESTFTVKIHGLTLRAEGVGFWLRAHEGILQFADEGIANVSVDESGMDVEIDVEVGRAGAGAPVQEQLEREVKLKAVRVRVHKLDYEIRKSRKLKWLAWVVKPLLRPVLRRVVAKQVAGSIAGFWAAANREIVFARERLRATRVAEPEDLWKFVKAVLARLQPEEDPEVSVRVGVDAPGGSSDSAMGKGNVFEGVYAPGSLVKVWRDEEDNRRMGEVREEVEGEDGWRDGVFDLVG
ncbi:MAG: hypothetical protein M1831_005689 [Alyxoria varia]|nr:MAG: hypothetical protein M1831_005689 [Alyxoria varia]